MLANTKVVKVVVTAQESCFVSVDKQHKRIHGWTKNIYILIYSYQFHIYVTDRIASMYKKAFI
jgi:hypothetical protein